MKKTLLFVALALLLASPSPARGDDVLKKLDSIQEAITTLTENVKALEKRLAAIETALNKTPEKKTKAPRKKPRITPKDSTPIGPAEFVSIGGGCLLGNLSYKSSLGNTIFSGVIENQSSNNYKTVIFNLKVFNKKNINLGGSDFYLQELYIGTEVPFEVTIFGVDIKSIAGYEINFVRGF